MIIFVDINNTKFFLVSNYISPCYFVALTCKLAYTLTAAQIYLPRYKQYHKISTHWLISTVTHYQTSYGPEFQFLTHDLGLTVNYSRLWHVAALKMATSFVMWSHDSTAERLHPREDSNSLHLLPEYRPSQLNARQAIHTDAASPVFSCNATCWHLLKSARWNCTCTDSLLLVCLFWVYASIPVADGKGQTV